LQYQESIFDVMKHYKFKKYWFLGFLGLIGFYELPTVIDYFQGQTDAWALLNLLWFLWFDHFIPKKTKTIKN